MRVTPLIRRAGWGLGDQALSSLTNFTLGVLIARTVGVEQFGAFSLAFATYLLVLSVCRAYPMEPLAIRYSASPAPLFRRAAAAAVGSVFVISVASALVVAVFGVVTGGALSQALLAVAVTLPGLLVQDAWRSVFFAWRRGRSAFINDLIWAIVMFPALGVVIASGDHSVFWPTLVWGASATVAALAGLVQSGIIPEPLRTRAWWREHIDLGPRFVMEVGARTAGSQLSAFGIGAAAGLAALGALRAASLILGPVQILFFGIGLIAVPEGVRAVGRSLGHLRRLAIAISTLLAIFCIAWGAIALLLPHSVGVALLGSTWDPARAVLLPSIVAQIGAVLTSGPGMGLRTLAAARRSLNVSVMTATLAIVLGVGGAVVAGTPGAAWGLAIAALFAAVLWWWAFGSELALRARLRESTDEPPPTSKVDQQSVDATTSGTV